MTEIVKPYKLESTASGGSTNDFDTTEVDPINDSIAMASVCLQRTGNAVDDAVRVFRTSSDEIALIDKVTGQKTLSQLAATSSGGITALTGDVTASGAGSVAATVASVGGATAQNVASAASLVAASRTANTFYGGPGSGSAAVAAFRALVAADLPTVPLSKIDTTGATSGSVLVYSGSVYAPGTVSALTALTGDVTASGSGSQPATVTSVGGSSAANVNSAVTKLLAASTAGYVLTATGVAGGASYQAPAVTGINALTGDVTASGTGSQAATVASVGGSSAANVNSAVTKILAASTNGYVFTANGSAGGGSFQLAPVTGINALTGDVTASGTGSQAATVASVGGSSASNVNSAVSKVLAASTAGYVLTATGTAGAAAYSAPAVTGINALTGDVTASGTGSQPATVASVGGSSAANINSATSKVQAASTSGYVLTANGTAGGASYLAPAVTGINALTGDVTATGTGSQAATVASVGGSSAANVNTTVTKVLAASTAGYVLTATGAAGGASYQAVPASGITALTGDVTASGSGSQAATVASVGGSTASNVNSATTKVLAASTSGYVLTANGTAGGASFQPAASGGTSAPNTTAPLASPAATDTGKIFIATTTNTSTLPVSPATSTQYTFINGSGGAQTIGQGAGAVIYVGNTATTVGTGGYVTLNGVGSSITIVCAAGTNVWYKLASAGQVSTN